MGTQLTAFEAAQGAGITRTKGLFGWRTAIEQEHIDFWHRYFQSSAANAFSSYIDERVAQLRERKEPGVWQVLLETLCQRLEYAVVRKHLPELMPVGKYFGSVWHHARDMWAGEKYDTLLRGIERACYEAEMNHRKINGTPPNKSGRWHPFTNEEIPHVWRV